MTGRPVTKTNHYQTSVNQNFYKANKDQIKNKVRMRQKELQTEVAKIKLKLGCQQCGYRKIPQALQFHHPDKNKEHNIARMATQGRSLESIKKEISKCVCLCSNCHAEEHYPLDEGLLLNEKVI